MRDSKGLGFRVRVLGLDYLNPKPRALKALDRTIFLVCLGFGFALGF